jgi:multisubunit Na+/H+ antiporter MnhG subunit
MSGREIAVVVLLGLAALVVALSAVGFVAARDALARLHFVTPVTSVAAPLTGAAYAVQQGPGLAAGLGLLTVVLLAVTGPVLGSAVARVSAAEDGLLPAEDAP